MENIYRINSTDLRIVGIREIFEILEKTFIKFDIDFYLIGAVARDIMTIAHNEKQFKATQDIDIAVMVSGHEIYYDLLKYLIEKENFKEDNNQPYRLYYGNKLIDLLPFGEI